MRTLPVGLLLVLILATPSWGQGPGGMNVPAVTTTDKSSVDQPAKKIDCKATVVGVGGAVVQSVKFEVVTGAGGVADPGGQGTKQNGTDDWSLRSGPLLPGTYKVKITVTYTLPGDTFNRTKPPVLSGPLVILAN